MRHNFVNVFWFIFCVDGRKWTHLFSSNKYVCYTILYTTLPSYLCIVQESKSVLMWMGSLLGWNRKLIFNSHHIVSDIVTLSDGMEFWFCWFDAISSLLVLLYLFRCSTFLNYGCTYLYSPNSISFLYRCILAAKVKE